MSIYEKFTAGYADGQKIRQDREAQAKHSKLASLASTVFSSPQANQQGYIAEAMGIDPQFGITLQDGAGKLNSQREENLVKGAEMLVNAPEAMRPQLYASFKATNQHFGYQLPDEYTPEVAEMASQIVASRKKAAAPKFTYTNADGKMVAIMDDGTEKVYGGVKDKPTNLQPRLVPQSDGSSVEMIFDPRTGQYSRPNYGDPSVSAGVPSAPKGDWSGHSRQAFAGAVNDVAKTVGGRITGGMDEAGHNTNSVHNGPTGAFDVGMGRETSEQQERIIAAYRADGRFNIRDERTRPPGQAVWSGPHIHITPKVPFGGNVVASTQGSVGVAPRVQGPQMGVKPTKAAIDKPKGAPSGYRWNATGTALEPIPGGPANKPGGARSTAGGNASGLPLMSAGERKDAVARKAKVPLLQNAVRGLTRIDAALDKLDGALVNTGPLDQHVTSRTPQGQELVSAVNGIQETLLSLTRVPGMGSQSDMEARIAGMKFPSLEMAPEVNKATMKQLRAFVADLARQYATQIREDDARIGGGQAAPQPQGSGGGASRGTPAVGTVKNGYRFNGGNPANPKSWSKI
ncbi:hypothetical protein V3390_09165 [Luteimonas sp. FXH3W]|uniref:Uncharacterized protein n=1 Tax=Aquilutibacter rugosus TaxID=3115820 RepID=A0ABU7V0U2_9GAMM